MRPQDTAYIIERLAVRFMAMVADHERQLAEHRASFGARTEADEKIIAALREEVELANGECNVLRALTVDTAKYKANSDLFYNETKRRMDAESQCDRLRAEVAALQERLRASIARGDLAQIEVAALKSQTPKHPVKVGEWVRRITAGSVGPIGTAGSVMVVWSDAYQVQLRKGFSTFWSFKDCEPCDPPTEATHDTPTGKQVAEAAVKTEPVADEIKVGDVVEVFQSSSTWTFTDDVGKSGTITRIETVFRTEIVHLREHPGDVFALCDVRKETT